MQNLNCHKHDRAVKRVTHIAKIGQAGTVQYDPKLCGERSVVLQWCTCHYGEGWWGERILSQMTQWWYSHKCTALCTVS